MFIFYFIGSVVKIVFLFSLHKGRQTSKELKKNMNDGTIVDLVSLLIIFFIKKETLAQVFSCEFWKFSKNTFLTKFLRAAASDF